MNKWLGTGRLTKDVEIKTNGDSILAKFTLAVDRKFKKDEADFINCVAFGKTASFMEQFTHKGMKLEIEGRIQTGSYENKEGKKVYTTDIICDSVEFAESKKAGEKTAEKPNDDFVDIDEKELPFA